MLISQLGQDLLSLLCSQLLTDDVFRLLHTTKALSALYERPNFHQTLRYNLLSNAGLRLPNLALESSNLLELDLTGFYIPAFGALIRHLGPTLQLLRVNFWHGLQELYIQPSYTSIAELLPHLQELTIGEQCWQVPGWDATDWPNGLTSLSAPTHHFEGANLCRLPEDILHLDVLLQNCEGARLPANLISLNAYQTHWDELPHTLKHLELDGLEATLPSPKVDLSRLRSLKILLCVKLADLPAPIPSALTRLEISMLFSDEFVLAEWPPGLTHLDWLGVVVEKNSSTLEFIQSLPRSLTYIRITNMGVISSIEEIAALPPSLRKWDGIVFDGDLLSDDPPFPRTLTFAQLTLLDPGDGALFPGITHLEVVDRSLLYHLKDSFLRAFPSVSSLTFHLPVNCEFFDDRTRFTWSLPNSLTSLNLTLSGDPTIVSNTIAWPTGLQSLTLFATDEMESHNILLSGLPQTLRILDLNLPFLQSSSLETLPSRLTDLRVRWLESLSLSAALALSQRLCHLTIPIEDEERSSPPYLALPKSLTSLHSPSQLYRFSTKKLDALKAALPLLTIFSYGASFNTERWTFDRFPK